MDINCNKYIGLIEYFPLPFYVVKDEKIVFCNHKGALLFGTDREYIKEKPLDYFSPPCQPDGKSSREKLREAFQKAGESKFFRLRWLFNQPEGGDFWAEVAILYSEGDFYLVTVVNLDGPANLKYALNFTPVRDYLTGVYDKRFFREHLESICQAGKENEKFLALLFIDLDHFKEINDALGHQAGDKLLQVIAEKMEETLPPGTLIARYGGDEFVILLENVGDKEEAYSTARQIIEAISRPFYMEERGFFVSASIGISFYPADGRDADTLIKNADIAMYRAKAEKGAPPYRIRFFEPEMEEEIKERFFIYNCLRYALERDELEVYFHPIIDFKDGKARKAEVLLRWHNSDMGEVAPDKFIPVAEETGLIHEIGDFVLREACRFIKEWEEENGTPIVLSVNISQKQLENPWLAGEIKQMLDRFMINGSSLEFEITERVSGGDLEVIGENLKQIKDLGISVAMDDFGTGYSSLAMLLNLEVDKVKIDRSFVKNIFNIKENMIVKAVISIAQALGMEVVAEGVEEEEQIKILKDLGCHYGQGYFWAKPMPWQEFKLYLAG